MDFMLVTALPGCDSTLHAAAADDLHAEDRAQSGGASSIPLPVEQTPGSPRYSLRDRCAT